MYVGGAINLRAEFLVDQILKQNHVLRCIPYEVVKPRVQIS